jgi:hypothetical protein
MAHRHLFEVLDRTLQDVMKCNAPFGGKVVVLAGDFRQVLPVVPKGSRGQIVDACVKRSLLWNSFTTMQLLINMRVLNTSDPIERERLAPFPRWLLEVGEGIIGDQDTGLMQIPAKFCTQTNNSVDFVNLIFGDMKNDPADCVELGHRIASHAILTPKNDDVNQLNDIAIDQFPGDFVIYHSADKPRSREDALLYPSEFLHSLNPQGLPAHELRLKVGAPIMLLRNLNAAAGLANGTRLVITKLTQHAIHAEIVTGRNIGRNVIIPKIPMTPSDTNIPITFTRRQFPIKLAFAMTITRPKDKR